MMYLYLEHSGGGITSGKAKGVRESVGFQWMLRGKAGTSQEVSVPNPTSKASAGSSSCLPCLLPLSPCPLEGFSTRGNWLAMHERT